MNNFRRRLFGEETILHTDPKNLTFKCHESGVLLVSLYYNEQILLVAKANVTITTSTNDFGTISYGGNSGSYKGKIYFTLSKNSTYVNKSTQVTIEYNGFTTTLIIFLSAHPELYFYGTDLTENEMTSWEKTIAYNSTQFVPDYPLYYRGSRVTSGVTFEYIAGVLQISDASINLSGYILVTASEANTNSYAKWKSMWICYNGAKIWTYLKQEPYENGDSTFNSKIVVDFTIGNFDVIRLNNTALSSGNLIKFSGVPQITYISTHDVSGEYGSGNYTWSNYLEHTSSNSNMYIVTYGSDLIDGVIDIGEAYSYLHLEWHIGHIVINNSREWEVYLICDPNGRGPNGTMYGTSSVPFWFKLEQLSDLPPEYLTESYLYLHNYGITTTKTIPVTRGDGTLLMNDSSIHVTTM